MEQMCDDNVYSVVNLGVPTKVLVSFKTTEVSVLNSEPEFVPGSHIIPLPGQPNNSS